MVEVVRYGVEKGVFRKIDPIIIGNFIAHNTFFYPLRSWYFKNKISYEDVEKQVVDFSLQAILKRPKKK